MPALTGFILFSFMGTQDFLSWNAAKWKLGERLLNTGVPQRKISGGFPWDCWHTMDYCLSHPYEILPRAYDIPWWIEGLTPAIDPEYLISNSTVPTGLYYLKYYCTERYDAIDSATYFSLLYGKRMKLYVLKRVSDLGNENKTGGKVVYSFLNNLKGADIQGRQPLQGNSITAGTISVGTIPKQAIIQTPDAEVIFRVTIPQERCALKVSLATMPETWDKAGDGMTFKILMSDQLLENLYDEIGMVGVELQSTFLKPRSYFSRMRTIYMNYLDPKHIPSQRAWNNVTLDLSRFAGKVLDLSFTVEPGPRADRRFDAGVWGEPVIITY